MNRPFRASLILLHNFTPCERSGLGVRADRDVNVWEWIIHLCLANNFLITVHLTVPKAKYEPWRQWLRWGQMCNMVQGSNIMVFLDGIKGEFLFIATWGSHAFGFIGNHFGWLCSEYFQRSGSTSRSLKRSLKYEQLDDQAGCDKPTVSKLLTNLFESKNYNEPTLFVCNNPSLQWKLCTDDWAKPEDYTYSLVCNLTGLLCALLQKSLTNASIYLQPVW